MRLTAIVLIFFFTLFVPGSNAEAQPSTIEDRSRRADDLNAEGKKLADAGNLKDARSKLEQAWSLKKAYDIAGNFSRVETALGHSDHALELVEAALRMFPASGKLEHRVAFEKQEKELRPQVVAVELPHLPDGCRVRANDREYGPTPITGALYSMPGSIEIKVEHDGYRPVDTTVHGEPGGTVSPSLNLIAMEDGGGHLPPVRATRPKWPAAVGYGLTAVGLGAGIGTLVSANNHQVKGCLTPTDCMDTKNKQNALSNGSVWSFVAAGALATASTVYLAWSFGGKRAETPSTTLRLVPLGTGASAIVSF